MDNMLLEVKSLSEGQKGGCQLPEKHGTFPSNM